jgi:hypothetical protein
LVAREARYFGRLPQCLCQAFAVLPKRILLAL